MSKWASAFVCALICAGCSTPGDLRDGMPVLEQASMKSPEQIAGCIGDRLETDKTVFDSTNISVRPTSTGYSVSGTESVYTGSDTVLLIDIAKTPSGSDLKMFTHYLIGKGPPLYFAAVRDCAG